MTEIKREWVKRERQASCCSGHGQFQPFSIDTKASKHQRCMFVRSTERLVTIYLLFTSVTTCQCSWMPQRHNICVRCFHVRTHLKSYFHWSVCSCGLVHLCVIMPQWAYKETYSSVDRICSKRLHTPFWNLNRAVSKSDHVSVGAALDHKDPPMSQLNYKLYSVI